MIAGHFNRMATSIRRSRQELTSEIEDRKLAEQVLQNLVEEKDVLLQELHHRVKNNLQIMSSLLNLQIMRVDNDLVRLLLQGVRLKLISLSMVHEQVYLSTSMSQIDIAEFLRDLIAVVRQELKPDELELTFLYNLDPVYLQVDKATTVSILLNELLANAVLHAFPTGGLGTVRVAMQQDADTVMIILEDDGTGLPDSVDPEQPATLGLTLVQSLTAQLAGTVRFERLSRGVRVVLEFPLDSPPLS